MKRGDLHVGCGWAEPELAASDMDQHQLRGVVGEKVLRRTAETDKGLEIQTEDTNI